MRKQILVLNGHPDPRPERLCAALCDAYEHGARLGGHEVRRIDVGALEFPLLRSIEEYRSAEAPAAIAKARDDLLWADHFVVVFPLWLGATPALLKGFLEQVLKEGFSKREAGDHAFKPQLVGKSARLVITMGMPAAIFRLLFGAHGLRALQQGILMISGVKPLRHTILGSVEARSAATRERWLKQMERHGHGAD